ncbi:MAG: CPBP family intramembrane metalloprotease [Bacteroidales bacterium]|nr:CPBP family intramembrane metalloprotease [Bacteroidales bacterium]
MNNIHKDNRYLIGLLIITHIINLYSQEPDSITKHKPEEIPSWTLYVPGATSFYQKQYLAGTIFITLEIGGILLVVEKYYEEQSLSDVKQILFLDHYIPRYEAFSAFSSVSLDMSWSAGIGEEYICRNFLMPVLDYRFGQRKGLIFSSLIFGGLHFENVLFSDKPDYG